MNTIALVITVFLCFGTNSLEGRPFDDQIKQWPARILRTIRQLVEPITAEQSGPPPVPQRGSPEETRRILQEINKINQAFGYTRKSPDIALPRQGPGNTNYFYPRPVYQPAFIQNSKRPPYNREQPRDTRAIDPFRADTFYYPAPYFQLPLEYHHPINFNHIKKGDKFVVPYSGFKRPIVVVNEEIKHKKKYRVPKTMEEFKDEMKSVGTTTEKVTELRQEGNEYEDADAADIIESIVKVIAKGEEEELDNYENYDSNEASNEVDDEEEEDDELPNTPTLNPPLLNDKFIHNNGPYKDQPQLHGDTRKNNLAPSSRSFNFTTPDFIKNLTEKFANKQNAVATPSPIAKEEAAKIEFEASLKEKSQEDYDSEEISVEGLRAPWSGVFPGGPQSQRDVLKQGGLIIQRLRVKNGSIAVAGPGGVATAGSGGTAIVGPEGLAITHPRSLTIAGPGARVYEVPESTNLERQLRLLNADGTPENGVLVAVGPTVHYNSAQF